MAYAVIGYECIGCGFCEKFCSANAIKENEDTGRYYVKIVYCDSYNSCSDSGGFRRCYDVCILNEPPITFIEN